MLERQGREEDRGWDPKPETRKVVVCGLRARVEGFALWGVGRGGVGVEEGWGLRGFRVDSLGFSISGVGCRLYGE